MDYNIYLGRPIITCKTSKVEKFKTIRCCSNHSNCSNLEIYSRQIKFCQSCGSPIEEQSISFIADNVDLYRVYEQIKEKLQFVPMDPDFLIETNNVHLWISNVKIPNTRKFYFDVRNEQKCLTFENEYFIKEELDKFIEFFKEEIRIIKEQYGEKNVSIKWGIVNWCD